MALGSNGTAYAWGNNGFGQLGDGTTTSHRLPTAVKLPVGIKATQVSMGVFNAFAIGSDGKTYAWGDNSYGQLGTGTTTDSSLPKAVLTPAEVKFVQIAAGEYHTVALGDNGRVYSWGFNGFGQLGTGPGPNRLYPEEVPLPGGISASSVQAGIYHSTALGSAGQVYSWGINDSGQLGDGTLTNRNRPTALLNPNNLNFTELSGQSDHVMALADDNKLYSWGFNDHGQLGDGTRINRTSPVETLLPSDVQLQSFSAGGSHTIASRVDGTTYAWGSNTHGQLGDGTLNDHPTPTQLTLPSGVSFSQVSAAYEFSSALADNGRLYSWGSNRFGQIADGTLTEQHAPTPSATLSVSSVMFGDTPSEDVTQHDDGTIDALSPPHQAGSVDVVVNSVFKNGLAGPSLTYLEGYTFTTAPVAVAPNITSENPPNGKNGSPYRFQVTASGTAPVTFEISTGTLPSGLSLDENTGAISGTPDAAGEYSFTVTATNAAGSDTQTYVVTITSTGTPPTSPPPTSLPPTTYPVPTPSTPPQSIEERQPGQGLAVTGGSNYVLVATLGGALLVGGAILVLLRRTRRSDKTD